MSNYDILFVYVTGSNILDSKNKIRFERIKGFFNTPPLNGDSMYSSSTLINGKINFTLNDIIREYSNQGIFDINNINVVEDLRAISSSGISSGGKRKSRKCRKTRRRRKTRKCRKTRRRY